MRSRPHDSGATPSLDSLRGVTASDADDGSLVPALLVAVTVNVYAVPFVSPLTTHVSAPVVAHVRPLGEAVTV
jgi:hypothetical protein